MSSQLDRASLSSTSLIGPPGTTRPPSRAALADSLRSKSLSPQSAWEQKEGSRLSYGRMGISPTSRPTTASRDGSSSASPSPTGKSARRRSSGGLASGRYGPQPRAPPAPLPLQSAILPTGWTAPIENIEDADDHMARRRKSKQAYKAWKSGKDSKIRMDSLKSQSMVALGGRGGGGGGQSSVDRDALMSRSLSPAKSAGGMGFMALLAVAKFKAGGQRNHDQWLLEKEAERRAEFAARRQLREFEDDEARRQADADADNKAHFASVRLEQMKASRENMKMEMLMQTSQLDFVPSRPTSSIKRNQRKELVEPTEQEQWELGFDILKLQDMLDAAAPGLTAANNRSSDSSNGAAAKANTPEGDAGAADSGGVGGGGADATATTPRSAPRKRTERFPKKLPAVPTHESIKGTRSHRIVGGKSGGGRSSGGGVGSSSGYTSLAKSAVRLKKLVRSPTPPDGI